MNRRFACKTVSIVLLLTVLASCFLGWMRVGGDISVSPVRLAVISSKTVKFQEELSLAGETAEKLEPALKAIFVGQLLFLILLAILVLHTLVMHLLDRRYKGIPIFTALLGVALLPVIFTIALDGFSIAYGLYLGFGAALLSVVFWSLAGQSEQEEEIPTVAVWKPSADYAPPRTCPNCGASVDAKRTFCTACGASRTPPTAKVRNCAGCGAPLEEGSAAAEACTRATSRPASSHRSILLRRSSRRMRRRSRKCRREANRRKRPSRRVCARPCAPPPRNTKATRSAARGIFDLVTI